MESSRLAGCSRMKTPDQKVANQGDLRLTGNGVCLIKFLPFNGETADLQFLNLSTNGTTGNHGVLSSVGDQCPLTSCGRWCLPKQGGRIPNIAADAHQGSEVLSKVISSPLRVGYVSVHLATRLPGVRNFNCRTAQQARIYHFNRDVFDNGTLADYADEVAAAYERVLGFNVTHGRLMAQTGPGAGARSGQGRPATPATQLRPHRNASRPAHRGAHL